MTYKELQQYKAIVPNFRFMSVRELSIYLKGMKL